MPPGSVTTRGGAFLAGSLCEPSVMGGRGGRGMTHNLPSESSSRAGLFTTDHPDPPGPCAVRVRFHRFWSWKEKQRRCWRTDSVGHIIPIAAPRQATHAGLTNALRRRRCLPFLLLLFKKPRRAEPSRAVRRGETRNAAGVRTLATAVRADVAEMWLPVRLAASHLRTQHSHTAPWIDPG